MQKISTSQPGQEPDGDRDFPRTTAPAKDASHSARSFPVPLTPLIGRERELELAQAKLKQPEVRLLTLIGSPGVGKTRLSLELATRLEKSFAQGMYFVSLASVFDPQLVMPAIGRAVHLSHKDTVSPLERLQLFFEQKHVLMLLDNFEQVLPAAPQLVELLTSCPHLKLVITSRAALQIGGEYELVINPLALPDPLKYPTPDDLARIDSVVLFLQRIEAVKPEFQLTKANAPLISKLCQKLAGVPLAIELAAARCKVLSLQAISSRLEQGLTVLSGNRQDAPVRHHSLHDTINWSYQLLSPEEQALFRCLSVFAGTFTLDAAENVTAFTGLPSVSILDGISSLLDKSLLQQDENDGSDLLLHQLETIRQFGMEQLVIHDELADCREAHATYYLALAEQAGKAWHGPEEARWVHILGLEYVNIQVALVYFLEQNKHVELLRLATAMGIFWFYRGYLNEGRHYSGTGAGSEDGSKSFGRRTIASECA